MNEATRQALSGALALVPCRGAMAKSADPDVHFVTIHGRKVPIRPRHGEAAETAAESPAEEYARLGTKSSRFISWFGPWDTDPESASKVVKHSGEPAETYNIPGEGSVVTDDEGQPIVVYHGTAFYFNVFDTKRVNNDALYGPGFYFTEDRAIAESYTAKEAWQQDSQGGLDVKSVYLSIRRPLVIEDTVPWADVAAIYHNARVHDGSIGAANAMVESNKRTSDNLDGASGEQIWRTLSQLVGNKKAQRALALSGYDGITHIGGDRQGGGYHHRVWIAFEPTQIKAVANEGTFNSDDADIYKAASTAAPSVAPPTTDVHIPGESSTGHFYTPAEIESMNLNWRTLGVGTGMSPVLLPKQELGDESNVVHPVGGSKWGQEHALGAFQVSPGKEQRVKSDQPAPEKPPQEFTPEQQAQIEQIKVNQQHVRQLREQLQQVAVDHLTTVGVNSAPSPEEEQKVADAAKQHAATLGASEKGQQQLADRVVQEYRKERQREVQKASQLVVQAALDQLADSEATGATVARPVDIELTPTAIEQRLGLLTEGQKQRLQVTLTEEQASKIGEAWFQQEDLHAQEKQIEQALKSGEPHVVENIEATIRPMSAEEVKAAAIGHAVDLDKIKSMVRLLDIARQTGVTPDVKAAIQGVTDVATGFAAEITGKVPFGDATLRQLGPQESANLMAYWLQKETGGRAEAAEKMRQTIATQTHVVAAAAVQRCTKLLGAADSALRDAQGQSAILTATSAWAKSQRWTQEARDVAARALGGCEMAVAITVALEKGEVPTSLTIPGRSGEAATLQLAQDLGLGEGDYEMAEEKGQYSLKVAQGGMDRLLAPTSKVQWENEAELRDIDARRHGDGWVDDNGNMWRPDGVNEGIQLKPWQQADVKFWQAQEGVVIGDVVGSGKTASAFAGVTQLLHDGKVKRALIVVPAGLMPQWQREGQGNPDAPGTPHPAANGASPFLTPEYAAKLKSASGSAEERRKVYADPDAQITVVSMDALRHDADAIKAAGYDCIVADETQALNLRENAEASARRSAFMEIAAPAKYRMLMSGTTVESDLAELYSLAEIAKPGALGPQADFVARYDDLLQQPTPATPWLVKQLRGEVRGVFQGMQMSHAVGKDEQGHIVMERADNPEHPVRLHTHEIAEDMTGEERGAAREALQGVEVESAGKQGVGLARERTQQQHERKPRVRAVLKGMADATKEDPDRRGIIWAMHTHSADAVQEAVIAERGWKTATFEPAPGRKGGYVYKGGEVARIDGSTSGPEREAIKDAFNDPGSALRLIVATDAASTGLNMPGGSYSVHYDRGANGSVMPQRDGREYRPKQKADRVDVYQVGSTSAYTASEKLRAEKKTTRLDLADMVMSGDDSGTAEALANYLAPPS